MGFSYADEIKISVTLVMRRSIAFAENLSCLYDVTLYSTAALQRWNNRKCFAKRLFFSFANKPVTWLIRRPKKGGLFWKELLTTRRKATQTVQFWNGYLWGLWRPWSCLINNGFLFACLLVFLQLPVFIYLFILCLWKLFCFPRANINSFYRHKPCWIIMIIICQRTYSYSN